MWKLLYYIEPLNTLWDCMFVMIISGFSCSVLWFGGGQMTFVLALLQFHVTVGCFSVNLGVMFAAHRAKRLNGSGKRLSIFPSQSCQYPLVPACSKPYLSKFPGVLQSSTVLHVPPSSPGVSHINL